MAKMAPLLVMWYYMARPCGDITLGILQVKPFKLYGGIARIVLKGLTDLTALSIGLLNVVFGPWFGPVIDFGFLKFLGHVINGLAGYYRRFIEKFSKIAKCLTILTQKCKTFDWDEEQELAFQTLKDKLCNAPVLALFDGPKDFVVYCDASGIGLGCVLMQ
ncbi:putative reverse transcriptase domain-containing protein [Tanacetum coccineum]|uniref:Reverse transcriptase domain-containing protein n=1 Tax=Tanacetum coccineum TaxID=301880 RepID=A0ABQ5DH28_9ASTR